MPPQIPDWIPEFALRPLAVSAFTRGASDADGTLDLAWGDATARFRVVYRPLATPRKLDEAVVQLRRLIGGDPTLHPMVVAPFLSPKALDQLQAAGLSGVDRCGNLRIETPGQWLLARSGAPNQFPTGAPVRNPFKGRTALIPMALLATGSGVQQAELVRTLRTMGPLDPVAPGSISRVLSHLEDERLVRRLGRELLLDRPEALLDALANALPAPAVTRRLRTLLKLDPRVGRQLARTAATRGIPTAGEAPYLWVNVPNDGHLTRLWTTDIDGLLSELPHEDDSPAPDVELLETRDAWPFLGAASPSSLRPPTMAPLPLYLILRRGGTEERHAAALLRTLILEQARARGASASGLGAPGSSSP